MYKSFKGKLESKKLLKSLIIFTVFLLAIVILVSGARLPTVSEDSGNWGTLLNQYLEVEHGENGTHGNLTVGNLSVTGNLSIRGPLPWADVTAYGAKGDGVTDDTSAIHAAIARD